MNYLMVFFGGAIGSLLRYLVSVLGNQGGFPFGTLSVNILGAFLLGYVTHIFFHQVKFPPLIVRGVSTGLIGSFTTFSALSVEMANYILNEEYFYFVSYLFVSVLGGLVFALLGYALGGKRGRLH
ncbi:fluoride efflux transporter FluC [Bacillus sp. 2205SS5-2]|uniref:fluoride efflux transporter FluC n=1 Tax=Bacillus sp. 2205SS5-2 TaxID=3109031 RepID=UPI003003C6E4